MNNDGDMNYWENWMRRRMSRRSMLRRAGLTGLILAGGSSPWACTSAETPKAAEPTPTVGNPASTPTPIKEARPKRGGTLKIGVDKNTQPVILDPHTFVQGGDETYLRTMFDYLVNFDDRMEYTPARSLAESWGAVDDVTLLFKLRKGIKFSDGTEWNAQTLKFNLDRIANPATKSPRAYVTNSIKSVDYPDDYTAKVVLKEPMASILGELAHPGLGMTTPANVAKWDPKDLGRYPVGSGPFILTESVRDDHYLLTRNKEYWQKDEKGDQLPYLDAVKFMAIPDNTVRNANLTTGVIDVNLVTAEKDAAKTQEDPNLKVIIQEGMAIQGMFWNLGRAPFSSLNFRLACAWAVNREAIVKVVAFGIATPYVSAIMPSAAWAFDPNLPAPKYDPVKAKQYLDKALAEGIKPEFTTYAGSGATMQAAQMVQADLAKIGVKMNIVPEEPATAAFRYFTSYEIDSLFAGYTMGADPYSKMYVAHHRKGAYTPEKGSPGPAEWDTPEGYYAKLNPLMESANKTYDTKKRAKLLNDAAAVIADQVGYLGLYYRSVVMAANKKVEGITWGGDGKGRFERTWFKE